MRTHASGVCCSAPRRTLPPTIPATPNKKEKFGRLKPLSRRSRPHAGRVRSWRNRIVPARRLFESTEDSGAPDERRYLGKNHAQLMARSTEPDRSTHWHRQRRQRLLGTNTCYLVSLCSPWLSHGSKLPPASRPTVRPNLQRAQ